MKHYAPVLVLTIALATGACILWHLKSSGYTHIKVTRSSPDASTAAQPASKGEYDPYFNRVNFCPAWSLPS